MTTLKQCLLALTAAATLACGSAAVVAGTSHHTDSNAAMRLVATKVDVSR
jgi:hypothetical protein